MAYKLPGHGHLEQLWRFAWVSTGFIQYYNRSDLESMRTAWRHLTNIASGMMLSVEIGRAEHLRQESLLQDLDSED